MQSSKKKNPGKKMRAAQRKKNPPSYATHFTGSVQNSVTDNVTTLRIVDGYVMNSTSVSNAWNYNTVFKAADALSVQDYKDATLLWQESRVVGMEVEFHPTYVNDHAPNGIDLTYATPLFLCPFRQDTTALSGDITAFQHAGRKMHALNQVGHATIRADELAEMNWYPTSSPSAGVYGIKVWISGLTNGATTQVSGWGTFYVTWIVQFRRRTRVATGLDAKSSLTEKLPPVDKKDSKEQPAQTQSAAKTPPTKKIAWADVKDDDEPLITISTKEWELMKKEKGKL